MGLVPSRIRYRSMTPRRKPRWYQISGLKEYEFVENKKGQQLSRQWSKWAGDTTYGKVIRRTITKRRRY